MKYKYSHNHQEGDISAKHLTSPMLLDYSVWWWESDGIMRKKANVSLALYDAKRHPARKILWKVGIFNLMIRLSVGSSKNTCLSWTNIISYITNAIIKNWHHSRWKYTHDTPPFAVFPTLKFSNATNKPQSYVILEYMKWLTTLVIQMCIGQSCFNTRCSLVISEWVGIHPIVRWLCPGWQTDGNNVRITSIACRFLYSYVLLPNKECYILKLRNKNKFNQHCICSW